MFFGQRNAGGSVWRWNLEFSKLNCSMSGELERSFTVQHGGKEEVLPWEYLLILRELFELDIDLADEGNPYLALLVVE